MIYVINLILVFYLVLHMDSQRQKELLTMSFSNKLIKTQHLNYQI